MHMMMQQIDDMNCLFQTHIDFYRKDRRMEKSMKILHIRKKMEEYQKNRVISHSFILMRKLYLKGVMTDDGGISP